MKTTTPRNPRTGRARREIVIRRSAPSCGRADCGRTDVSRAVGTRRRPTEGRPGRHRRRPRDAPTSGCGRPRDDDQRRVRGCSPTICRPMIGAQMPSCSPQTTRVGAWIDGSLACQSLPRTSRRGAGHPDRGRSARGRARGPAPSTHELHGRVAIEPVIRCRQDGSRAMKPASTSTSRSTRSGWSAAIPPATTPPIECPITCARSMPDVRHEVDHLAGRLVEHEPRVRDACRRSRAGRRP